MICAVFSASVVSGVRTRHCTGFRISIRCRGKALESFHKIPVARCLNGLLPDEARRPVIDADGFDRRVLEPMATGRTLGRGYRAAVAGRVLLALVGGYALAALATAVLSLTLPLDPAEAVTVATLLSFAVMAVAVLFVFAARSLHVATLWLGLPIGALGLGLWLLVRTGGST
ncbi:hypothetical protein HPGCJGGD_4070 [Methylobacterium haplocladii]|nr:hypothetical protein HPGCJGGD_4070 [Methylobacterium haplocladii]